MKKLRIIFIFGLFALIALPSATSEVVNISSKNTQNNSEPKPLGVGPIYIGEMYISGDGNKYTAIVRSTAEQGLKIRIPRGEVDVEFKAHYYIDCRSWCDHGYVSLWVRGAATQQTDSGEFDSGFLYTTVPHCERGDNLEWTLTTTYLYSPIELPIITADGGGGVCTWSYANNRLISSPILNRILSILQSRQIVAKGNIIFE